MELSLLHLQLLSNNTCHFPNFQKTFQLYKTDTLNSSNNYLQTDLWTSFKDCGLFRTFANPLKASYEDNVPTLQLELINFH